METHSEFATNRFITKEDKIHCVKQREQLTANLNDVLFDGPSKVVKQWQPYYEMQIQLENGNNDILQYSSITTSVVITSVEIVNVESDTDINTEPRTLEEKLESEINKKTDELTDVECLNNEQVVKINIKGRPTKGRPTDTKRRRTTKTIQQIKKKICCVVQFYIKCSIMQNKRTIFVQIVLKQSIYMRIKLCTK